MRSTSARFFPMSRRTWFENEERGFSRIRSLIREVFPVSMATFNSATSRSWEIVSSGLRGMTPIFYETVARSRLSTRSRIRRSWDSLRRE